MIKSTTQQAGTTPPWPAHLQTGVEIKAWNYEANCGRTMSEVLEESHQVLGQLLAVVEGLPDDILVEPPYNLVQLGDQRLSASEFFVHCHKDHEPDVRAWLARVENR